MARILEGVMMNPKYHFSSKKELVDKISELAINEVNYAINVYKDVDIETDIKMLKEALICDISIEICDEILKPESEVLIAKGYFQLLEIDLLDLFNIHHLLLEESIHYKKGIIYCYSSLWWDFTHNIIEELIEYVFLVDKPMTINDFGKRIKYHILSPSFNDNFINYFWIKLRDKIYVENRNL
ncbi:hypothetical protein [Phocoenobacter skyensis]|uniref:hypothetical protein n=1 Tax=Phocoenobacter skyensis TaxID=97481 RepID=UPI0027764425|nr:hypothetical protein [Pasteurella skyensis]MDP8185299.1 hypothetical protein [Pasteurella skyensis]